MGETGMALSMILVLVANQWLRHDDSTFRFLRCDIQLTNLWMVKTSSNTCLLTELGRIQQCN